MQPWRCLVGGALSFLFAVVVTGCSLSLGANPPVRIGIIGDQTGTSNLDVSYALLEKGVHRLSAENVAVVLHTGDLLESSVDPAQYRDTFVRATAILDRLPVPWYLTPGDHDVNPPPPFVQDSGDRSREILFRELYGLRRPEAKNHLYYSFDAAGYHFIALYSHEALDADPRWGVTLLAGLSAHQRQWLAADLKDHQNAEGIVVFLHQPLWYDWTRWREIHALLRRYPVLAVIAGHFHYNQDDGLLDGIRYVNVGATGGSTKRGSSRAGNLQHVTLLTLRGRHLDFQVLPLDSHEPVTLTPRADMDRVQMLDMVLDTLFDFERRNPLFLKGGVLVSSCSPSLPPRLELVTLGNPLDVPLKVTIRVSTPRIELKNVRFVPDTCLSTHNGEQCELRPGARVASANLSSVEFTWGCAASCAPPPALWTATPLLNVSPTETPKTLDVSVVLSFVGMSGDLFLERQLSTQINACP